MKYRWGEEMGSRLNSEIRKSSRAEHSIFDNDRQRGASLYITDLIWNPGNRNRAVDSVVLSGVNPKFISFCAETAHATASAISTASEARMRKRGV